MTSTPASSSSAASFHILTFGCQMNARDSQWLAARLAQLGLREAPLEEADIALLNTCSVREKPELKVGSAIKNIQQRNPKALIGVLGCVAQQLGRQLFEDAGQIALVAGGDSLALVPEAVLEALARPGSKLALLDIAPRFRELQAAPERPRAGAAFVNIMQGCGNRCAYCIVPLTRGPQKSRSADAVLAECRRWLEAGAIELALLGQNVNAWQSDGRGFAWLLREIAALPGLRRLRFTTSHPADFSAEMIACFADLPQLCPCLHLPLQSGSDRILKLMRRRHGRAEYLALVDKLRLARPGIGLTTDLIVGFPGEAEADFHATLTMLEACAFISSFSFCYSDRPGTEASQMPDKIGRAIQLERLGRLQALQEELTAAWLASRVGCEAEIRIERPSPRGGADSWQGRDAWGIPVHVALPPGAAQAGRMLRARITAAKRHSLTGDAISG